MTTRSTQLVHPPSIPGEPAGATSTPIYQTATFAVDPEAPGRWDYSRSGNPTRDVLEAQLARLDGARRAFAYTSGLAAVRSVLSVAHPGQQIVVGDDLYGGTTRLLRLLDDDLGVTTLRVDPTDPAALAAALDSGPTALLFLETPTNPRLRWVDLATPSRLCRARGIPLAVDNSMLSPYLLRPLELGADLAVQSATKLLGGHSDLTAGVVSTSDPGWCARLASRQNAEGTALAPFPCWLLLRGLETLAVRVDRATATSRALASWLKSQPWLRRLYVPSRSPGVVLSFETGSLELSRRLVANTRLFRSTVSFGGVSSSISLPCQMSHAALGPEALAAHGLQPDLVRLSIGLEDPRDLIRDLSQAAHQPDSAEPRSAASVEA